MKRLLLLLALLAFPAHAQTVEERLEKARTEINTVENATDRAVYACTRDQRDKCILEARTAANAAGRALYAVDQALIEARKPAPEPTTPPSDDSFVVVIDGDSNVLDYGGYYAGRWKQQQAGAQVFNLAASGSTMVKLLARVPDVLALKPDLVYIGIGGNDLTNYASPQAYFDTQAQYVQQLRAGGVGKVVVGTVIPHYFATNANLTAKYNLWRKHLAELQQAAVGTVFDAVVPLGQHPFIGPDEAAQNPQLYKDGIHLSDIRWNDQPGGHSYALAMFSEVMGRYVGHAGHEMPDQPVFELLTVADIAPIASNFDTAAWLTVNAIPSSAAPDVVGAFRFVCNTSHSNYDDPIVYPGQPGKAHLHGYFGNTATDAHSTYDSLRKNGDGTCHGGPLNRSAYWKPELLNGAGHIVREDHIVVYYKRRPKTDPQCAIEGKACVGIPPGLRAIFGTNYSTAADPSPHVVFRCNGPSGDDVKHPTLGPAAANCAAGNRILATVHTPPCWDGVNLDSADHQSHLAHELRDRNSGQVYCPSTHAYIIPEVTLTFSWSVLEGDDPTTWRFSSDIMAGKPAGSTFHADYMEAWDPPTRLAWEAACIDKLLNCSDGTMGDGRKLKRPASFTFAQRPHLEMAP